MSQVDIGSIPNGVVVWQGALISFQSHSFHQREGYIEENLAPWDMKYSQQNLLCLEAKDIIKWICWVKSHFFPVLTLPQGYSQLRHEYIERGGSHEQGSAHLPVIVIGRQRSCGKVMFSIVSVSLSVYLEGGATRLAPSLEMNWIQFVQLVHHCTESPFSKHVQTC